MYLKNTIIVFIVFLIFSCSSKKENDLKIKDRDSSFDEMFSILKENFIDKDSINWNDFEKSVLSKSKISKDSAIVEALTLLGNKHTSYIKADGTHLRGKFKKSMKNDNNICSVGFTSDNVFKNLKNIAYIKIDRIDYKSSLSEKEYILGNLGVILNQVDSDYWIIDLRDNTGGSIWPMLISLLPFYQDGIIGHNVFKKNDFSTPWFKREGAIYIGEQNQSQLFFDDKIFFTVHPKKVFVLINHKTMSAGEAAAISLKSLPNVTFLGSKTGGYATNNADVNLKNLDKIRLTVNYMGDFEKRIYKRGIVPDLEFCSQKDILDYIQNQTRK